MAMTKSILLSAVLMLSILFPGSGYGATARTPAPIPAGDAAAIDEFFSLSEVSLTLSPDQFLPEFGQVIVPFTLTNGRRLRVEIPWEDASALFSHPTVVIRPIELATLAGRFDLADDVVEIHRPVGAHVADEGQPTVCGNRKIVGEGFVEYDTGEVAEVEIGFIWAPAATDATVAAAAAGDGCPLLASRRDCQTHKDCSVSIGIPPFTITVDGKCYPGPWPLGKLCRCWLLAPD
jgi:hypothetical protein